MSWSGSADIIRTINREENLTRLGRETFDLVVIGGGITGAGIALDAASRGLKTLLLEKNDFASGTSSKSSKLIHGGLRYLKSFQFSVTFEASREKKRLKKLAPHLIEELPFIIPLTTGFASRRFLGTGLWIYDLAAGLPKGQTHGRIAPEEAAQHLPGLNAGATTGAFVYYDARADDCRLVLHVLQRAADYGAALINYAPVDGFVHASRRLTGVRCRGRDVSAKTIVNATGVWCDEVRRGEDAGATPMVRPSKGIHLVFSRDRVPARSAALLPCPDGRVVFLVPHDERVIAGTTDTDYSGDLEHPRAEEQDVEYLLDLLKDRLPGLGLTRKDILSTYAGLRPLLHNDEEKPWQASREHRIIESPGGLLTIAGGKLTTYRLMAAQVVDRVMERLGRRDPSTTRTIDLYAAPAGDALVRRYGSKAALIVDRTRIVPDLSYVWGEVDHAVEHEMAVTVGDILLRRTRLALFDREQGRGVAERVALRVAPRLKWDGDEVRKQVNSFEAELADYRW